MSCLYLKMTALMNATLSNDVALKRIYNYCKNGIISILQYVPPGHDIYNKLIGYSGPGVNVWILLNECAEHDFDQQSIDGVENFDGRKWYNVGIIKREDEHRVIYTEVMKSKDVYFSYGMLYGFQVGMSERVFDFIVDSEVEFITSDECVVSDRKLFYLENTLKTGVCFTGKDRISKYPYSGFEKKEKYQSLEIFDYMKGRYKELLKAELVSFLFCQTACRCFIEVVFSEYKNSFEIINRSYIYDLDIIMDDEELFFNYNDNIKFNSNKFIYSLRPYDYYMLFNFIDDEYYEELFKDK